MLEKIISERLGERYYKYTHSSGVTVLLYPMKGYSTVTAQFSVKFGSVDNCASINGGAPWRIPDGTAHYLEHKLFESPEKRSRGSRKPAPPAMQGPPTTARGITSAARQISRRTSRYCWISCSTRISPPRTLKRSAA